MCPIHLTFWCFWGYLLHCWLFSGYCCFFSSCRFRHCDHHLECLCLGSLDFLGLSLHYLQYGSSALLVGKRCLLVRRLEFLFAGDFVSLEFSGPDASSFLVPTFGFVGYQPPCGFDIYTHLQVVTYFAWVYCPFQPWPCYWIFSVIRFVVSLGFLWSLWTTFCSKVGNSCRMQMYAAFFCIANP